MRTRAVLRRLLLPRALDIAVRSSWPQRKFLRDLLRRLSIDCVLDVGANVGQYGEDLRAIGYRGLIISFEPDPASYRSLISNIAEQPNWKALNVALGSHSTTATLNLMAASLFNSFRLPTEEDTDAYAAPNRVVGTAEVQIETLARVLPRLKAEHGFRRVFLKMDTQGFDLEVFRGAAGVHDQIVGIQSELPVKHLYRDSVHWTQAVAEYQAAGFDLAGFYKVNPGRPEIVEFDCYMVRQVEYPSQDGEHYTLNAEA